MTIPSLTVTNLKKAKNVVIGNPLAKVQLVRDTHFISTLIDCLNAPYSSEKSTNDALRIEAAHIIASLSYGSEEALGTLLRANAHHAFVYAISYFTPSEPLSVRAAFSRALRTLAASIADVVGPSMWGLRPDRSMIRNEARHALEYLFQTETLDIYLPLLLPPSPSIPAAYAVSTSIAQMLSTTIRSDVNRRAVTEWLPPAERQREVKSRRGWEKTALSASHTSPWVARQLIALLGEYRREYDCKLVEACLSALAALAKENPIIATFLTKPLVDAPPLETILKFTKSRTVDVQLAACICITHILRALPPSPSSIPPPHSMTSPTSATTSHSLAHTPAPHKPSLEEDCKRTVINVVNGMISSPPSTDSHKSQTKACYILHHLVSDNDTFCHDASKRGCLDNLGELVRSINPTESDPNEWEEGEPESLAALREAALIALASLALSSDDIRRRITDELSLLPCISRALRAKRHTGTRYAACQCVRAISRAVSVLRTSIVDSGLGMDVLRIVLGQDLGDRYGGSSSNPGTVGNATGKAKEGGTKKSKDESSSMDTSVTGTRDGLGEDRRVLGAALSAVCNIVNDFSPLRPIYLEEKLMPRLVYILRESGDPPLRLNALWAVKNLVKKTSTETKRDIMSHIGWTQLSDFLSDADEDIQEQGFYTLRNLAENEEGIAMIFRELGPQVLEKIVAGLRSSCTDVVLQAAFAIANLANGSHDQQDMILRFPGMLTSLQSCLAESTSDIRRPAVSCILTLAQSNPRRRKEMMDAGIISTLRRLCEWSGHSTHGLGHGHNHPPAIGVSLSPTSGGAGHWGGRSPLRSPPSHAPVPVTGVYGSWGGSGSMHHHSHSLAHHVPASGRIQPYGHTSHHSWSSPMALEDDRDVIQRARTALEWLERGETYLT
ncbi:Armadillo repeat-containing protein 8 [Psilocybe cubensis]|uniref:Armadillo repeat-containing protein 8 n=2 Tax=Psilocybe cubensis TaxID=181762 RepID=A0ACB8H9L3_PSICU|nr:Armadillo repeat-containing protein 8 [Psilocybe cubensis]KAH9484613.1 Armadillo repeat-containing protein 8 [Psilocybe cubensis]